MRFKVGDEVTLTPTAMAKYGLGLNQGGGGRGRVVFAAERQNDPLRPYLVLWESDPEGPPNSYREEELQPAGFRFQMVEH
ncbi:MAG TPA: hypothetical protein VN436_03855 [Holophaga sp.]|nr:hypothetical protein [Holophaga sp.]